MRSQETHKGGRFGAERDMRTMVARVGPDFVRDASANIPGLGNMTSLAPVKVFL